jgi:hypothetical protein
MTRLHLLWFVIVAAVGLSIGAEAFLYMSVVNARGAVVKRDEPDRDSSEYRMRLTPRVAAGRARLLP